MNIYESVQNAAVGRLEKTAMILWCEGNENREYKYGEMLNAIGLFADSLSATGMQKGFRVAIVAESCPEWSIAYLAIQKLGGTPALLDSSLPGSELLDLLNQSDPACVYASNTTLKKLGDCNGLPVLNIHDNGKKFPAFAAKRCPLSQSDCDEKVASIIFSSGTTRRASGIMHSHEAIIGSSLMCCNNNGVGSEDRFFGVLPCSHIYGLYVQVVAPLILGGTVCFIEKMDAGCLVGALQGFKPTVFPAVPKVFELLRINVMKIINSNDKTKRLFNIFFPICFWLRKHFGIKLGLRLFKSVNEGFGGHLNVIASAGAPTDKETAEFFYGVGLNLLITYGATETSIPVIGNYGGQVTTETCGRPYPEIEIKLTTDGEFLVKSPYLMLGYFRDIDSTNASFDAEGWFKTGDQGYIDNKQNVHFNGRLKDNIVLPNGKKVAPDDIEDAYKDIPLAKDFAICGIPVSQGKYDRIHAFVVADAVHQDEVHEAFLERSRNLGQNMKLQAIHFVGEIPKTTLQKPKRFLLRQEYQSGAQVKNGGAESAPTPIPVDTRGFLVATIARIAEISITEVKGKTHIFEDISIDSLSALELILEIESYMGREFEMLPNQHTTLDELVQIISDLKEFGGTPLNQVALYNLKAKRSSDYNIFNACRRFMANFYDIRVENDNLLPTDKGYIICSNHVSNFDFLFLTSKFRKEQFMTFCCMTKQELLKKTPLSSKLSRIAGMIPVDREGNAAISMKTAKQKLMENWGLLIHPEGTRTRNGEMGTFKHGAALLALNSGAPIVPAFIKGGYEVYPATRLLPRLFKWKTRKRFNIEVTYGNPISPENQTVETIMQRLNAAIHNISMGENR